MQFESNDFQIREYPTLNVYVKGELKDPYGGKMTAEELVFHSSRIKRMNFKGHFNYIRSLRINLRNKIKIKY